jgi:alpha-L-fucosidase
MPNLSRRAAVQLLGAAPAFAQARPRFEPNWTSLQQYRCPDWFRDAKFGIWAHWGPQGLPRQGDWYARNMYIPGTRQYKYHLARYGHPSRFGFKDIIPLWKGENWEPETLIRRYKRAGARYFFALGVHCDNFDCWNSSHHRWNSVNFGPKKDVVGVWARHARAHGLRFGVSEHLAWSYDWFNVNKGADKEGPLAGVPYDGNLAEFQDLYHAPHPETEARYPAHASDVFRRSWFNRVKDLIDQHQPDLVYTDGGAFEQVGLDLIAHYYRTHPDGVYLLKNHTAQGATFGDYREGAATLDVERGAVPAIYPAPFHTDTCVGQWQYFDGFPYKKSHEVIHKLLDVVSKNGTMLLNFPQLPDGTLDTTCEGILDDITRWMQANGEGIFSTRPWQVFGEGPTAVPLGHKSEDKQKPFTPQDLRFTQRAGKVFIYTLGVPTAPVIVEALGTAAKRWDRPIAHVRLLGSDEKLSWTRTAEHLSIDPPRTRQCEFACGFEVSS